VLTTPSVLTNCGAGWSAVLILWLRGYKKKGNVK